MLETAFAIEKVHERMDELHTLIAPYVMGQEGEVHPYTALRNVSDFEHALTQGNAALLPHVESRHEVVESALSSVGFQY